jgi:hypothetical protein
MSSVLARATKSAHRGHGRSKKKHAKVVEILALLTEPFCSTSRAFGHNRARLETT